MNVWSFSYIFKKIKINLRLINKKKENTIFVIDYESNTDNTKSI
jgi:hypothetical protein